MSFKGSVFIATSQDGFIARKDGSVDWLDSAGNQEAELGGQVDMGFFAFLNNVDCIIMGRKTIDVLVAMKLQPEQWPYGDKRIIMLSNTVKVVPEGLYGNVQVFNGSIDELVSKLESEGHQHAYIDGGTTIRNFLALHLIQEAIITKAPIILGEGIPLFDESSKYFDLIERSMKEYPNGFKQYHHDVVYHK